jgi:hypothetical protein
MIDARRCRYLGHAWTMHWTEFDFISPMHIRTCRVCSLEQMVLSATIKSAQAPSPPTPIRQ